MGQCVDFLQQTPEVCGWEGKKFDKSVSFREMNIPQAVPKAEKLE